ncbi:sigma-70 family RNA polymerase sigma factor [uncultured Bacteroides sp.]|uniref:RNA polymerase sigma factor n=1 Tax=uncultured Bacteroides sp. TaxID=162156 RepID=UPI00280B955E|nr:sigma-70 family RNA polymerase sigma factor [uncultured Bacteroides sp.]
MNHEERHIIASILSGRTEQFTYFLDTYGPQVFHLIVRMVGSPEDAEELTQDCFMKAFTHLSSFREDSSFSTWIYRIAYNEATSALRKKDKEQLSFDDRIWNSLSDKEIDEELDTENEVQIQRLQQALTQLKPDEQALVTLFYEEEKTIEEIAYIFHLTESNVKVRLHRIRKKLCTLMKEEI